MGEKASNRLCPTFPTMSPMAFPVRFVKKSGLCGNKAALVLKSCTTPATELLHKLRLSHYQTTNFRLFQIERFCRWQFQIWRKWKNVIQTGRKHCRKRRNCSLRAISPFPTAFSKGFFPQASKGVIVWEWVKKLKFCLTHYQTTKFETCPNWNSLQTTIFNLM